MMRIVNSELKKILKSKIIFIVLAVFLLLNLTNIFRNYNISNGVEDYVVTGQLFLRENLDGELTDYNSALINQQVERLNALMSEEKYIYQESYDGGFITGYAYWDLQLWNSYKDYIDNAESYGAKIKEKTDIAMGNIGYYNEINSYYARENQLYYDTYVGREITEIFDSDGFTDYFDYKFSSVLSVIMLLLGVIPIFCNESESDMDVILLTSKNGRRKTVLAKIISALIYTFFIEVIFTVCDFAGFMCFDRPDGLTQVLYAVEGYEMSPISVQVWQFCLILFAMRLAGMMILCLIFLLFSKLFGRSIAPFILGTVTLFLLMSAKVFLAGNVNLINPVSLLVSYNYFKDFSVINLFGQPVFSYWVLCAVGILSIIILSAVIMLLPLKRRAGK